MSPSRFQRFEAQGAVLWVAPEFAEAALALDPLRPGALERLLADPTPGTGNAEEATHEGALSGSRGRGATSILPLAQRPERLHLRALRHGGWLAPLWGQHVAGLARALAESEVTASLGEAGAPVPQPAFVLGHRHGLLWRAAIATVYEENTRNGAVFLADGPSDTERSRAASAAARAIRRFHDAGGEHADLHIGNLILREDGNHFEVLIVDLDRARHGKAPSAERRMRELMRLKRSILKRSLQGDAGPAIEAAFLDEYVAGEANLRDAMLRHLPRERRRIARHAMLWRSASR